jgi:hypothetical protein
VYEREGMKKTKKRMIKRKKEKEDWERMEF